MRKHLVSVLMIMVLAFPLSAGAAATYIMKVTPSMPKGSAGEKPLATQPVNTRFSPCNSALVDAVTFSLAYNAGSGSDLLDVYMIFFNPNGDGFFSPRFYVVSKSALTTGGFALVPRNSLTDLDAQSDIYLPKEANPGVAITETLFGSFVSIDGVPAGTWQLVGIVADRSTIDFDDPGTWAAWDAATVILRKPWIGSANSVCQ
jgi:hypothetical protein